VREYSRVLGTEAVSGGKDEKTEVTVRTIGTGVP